MEKYQNKYRIPSTRLNHWDYRSAGAYFITTNTQNGEHYFGDVVDGKMQLSKIGIIANICWFKLTNHFDHLELGEYVIMPNHVHGILILHDNIAIGDRNDNHDVIDEKIVGDNGNRNIQRNIQRNGRDDACIVSTDKLPNKPPDNRSNNPPDKSVTESSVTGTKNEQMANISPKSGSVSRIVGSYKSAVSKHAHRLGIEFAWQERFYDHIIRNKQALERITAYIRNNPRNWKRDTPYEMDEI